jgi:hypothetical protein
MTIASQIKIEYLTSLISYETALHLLEKTGMGANEADNFLFAKDADWRVAQIKNGDITEGPALLAEMLPKVG